METWKITLIVIASVIVLAGIIAAIVVPIVLKKKKSKQKENITAEITAPEKEVIQLKAVKLKNGSGMLGFESKEELRERLNKLSKDEFAALNIDEYPWNQEQWNAVEGKPEEIYARNEYEIGIFFAYNYKHELKEESWILRREF